MVIITRVNHSCRVLELYETLNITYLNINVKIIIIKKMKFGSEEKKWLLQYYS